MDRCDAVHARSRATCWLRRLGNSRLNVVPYLESPSHLLMRQHRFRVFGVICPALCRSAFSRLVSGAGDHTIRTCALRCRSRLLFGIVLPSVGLFRSQNSDSRRDLDGLCITELSVMVVCWKWKRSLELLLVFSPLVLAEVCCERPHRGCVCTGSRMFCLQTISCPTFLQSMGASSKFGSYFRLQF